MIMRRANERPARLGVRLVALLSLVVLTVALAPAADAGSDDFDFAQKLAAKGKAVGDPAWFEYARQVLQQMIDTSNQVDLAKYGLATLKQQEALAAAGRVSIPYTDVKAMFDDAVGGIEGFVSKNPRHEKASQAKLDGGMVRLAFVQWARDLLGDRDLMAERATDEKTVQKDAQTMVEQAIRYFDELDNDWDADLDPNDPKYEEKDAKIRFAQVARYYWVICRYYAALVLTPCSEGAKAALESAGNDLEDFIGYFDGMLVATYAQDFYGLAKWELAKCATAEDEQAALYRSAVGWFETCIDTEHVDLDTLRIIGRGYYHIAQCCLDAGRIDGDNFYKRGATFLRSMLTKTPTVNTTDDGIKAMMEWAKLEVELDNTDKAIAILSEAGKKSEDTARPWLARKANKLIGEILARGSSGGPAATGSPDVLKRVADDQYASKNYLAAIGAYQQVIASCSDSLDDLMNYEVPAWERIAASYHQLGDFLSAALATQPIHNAWMDGRIPRKAGDGNDANLVRMGNIRRKAEKELKKLFDETGSPVYGKLWRDIGNNFKAQYPLHPSGALGELKKANLLYEEADKMRKAKKSGWRAKLDEATKVFETISKDPKSPGQHYALVKLIRCENMKEDQRAMVKRADAAFAYWAGPECQALMKEHETVADRVKSNQGLATYWKAVALLELKEYDQMNELIKDFGVKHGDIKNEFIKADVLGMLVLSNVKKGDIDTADTYLKRLIRTYPKYPRLPQITFELAKFFEAKYTAIEDKYKALVARKYATSETRADGLVYKLSKAEKDENYVAERLVDLGGERATVRRLINAWEEAEAEAKASGKPIEFKGATAADVDVARLKIKGQKEVPENVDAAKWPEKYQVGLDATIAGNNKRLKEFRALREKYEAELIEINKSIELLRLEMYPPLARAANYYNDWLQVLVQNGEKPSAKNLQIFGYRFYYATVLNPEVKDNWLKAKAIYETYIETPGITAEERSDVSAKLGRIYSHLSDVSDDDQARRDYVLKAVELLQAAVATSPENTNLIVGLLTGDFVVIPYQSPLDFQNYRIPIRRVKDIADFRQAVAQLGTESAPLPKFRTPRKQKGFDNAIRQFQKLIKSKKDKELQRTFKGFKTAGFDTTFFREHGNSSSDFRLSLARVYAQSPRPDDAKKALSIAHTLLNSRSLGLEENSEEYWEAQVIKYRAYAKAAEVGLAGANTKADAKATLELATKSLRALYSQNPSLGRVVRPQTAAELTEVLKRLNVLRQKAGMSPLRLTLTPKTTIVGADPDKPAGDVKDSDGKSGDTDDAGKDK